MSIEGQRKGISNDLRNCTHEFEMFIDTLTTQPTMDGTRLLWPRMPAIECTADACDGSASCLLVVADSCSAVC